MKRAICLVSTTLWLFFAACSEPTRPPAAAPPPAVLDPASSKRLDAALGALSRDTVAGQWARSCSLCHVDGNGGAPRVGDEAAWRQRAAAGEDTLLAHTLEGFGAMPPLGYCMDCTEADFSALIQFMIPASLRQDGMPK